METNPRTLVRESLRREFAQEQLAGFPTLKRIPSTHVVRFLDYFVALSREEQNELADALVDRGSYYFCPPLPIAGPSGDTYGRYRAATEWRGFGGGLRYTPIQLLAGVAKDTHIGGLDGWCRTMGFAGRSMEFSENLISGIPAIVPVKAAQLKKRIDAAFKPLFAPKIRDFGDKIYQYQGELGGCTLSLMITYSRRLGDPDMRYGVVVGHGNWRSSNMTCYEALFGAGLGWWDYITEENVERSVALFCDLLQSMTKFAAGLPKFEHADGVRHDEN